MYCSWSCLGNISNCSLLNKADWYKLWCPGALPVILHSSWLVPRSRRFKKHNIPSPSIRTTRYCVEPPWTRGSMLCTRPQCFELWILGLVDWMIHAQCSLCANKGDIIMLSPIHFTQSLAARLCFCVFIIAPVCLYVFTTDLLYHLLFNQCWLNVGQ